MQKLTEAPLMHDRLDRGPVREIGVNELTEANRQYAWEVNGRRVGWQRVFGPPAEQVLKTDIDKDTKIGGRVNSTATPQPIDRQSEPISQSQGDPFGEHVIAYLLDAPKGEPWSRKVTKSGIPKGPGRYRRAIGSMIDIASRGLHNFGQLETRQPVPIPIRRR